MQSEVYQLAMGDKSPPMEFVNMPTDMYIKEWYYNTGLQVGSSVEARRY